MTLTLTPTLLAGLIVISNLALTATIFWLRYQSNNKLFDTTAPLTPIDTKKRFFSMFNGLYDAMDRVPLWRRSGTANELDLLKAMSAVTIPYLIFNLIMHEASLFIWLAAFGVIFTLMNIILLMHPVTARYFDRR